MTLQWVLHGGRVAIDRSDAKNGASTMTTTSRLVLAAIIGTLGMALPARAQTITPPTFDLSAGYQFTHVPDENLPWGIAVDAARNWGLFSLVADGGWAFRSDEGTKINLWHVGAGPRWSSRKSATVTPYAQVIAGIAHPHVSFEGSDDSEGQTNFMLQPGGGVSVVGGDGWAYWFAADYRRVFSSDDELDDENQFRFVIGIRMVLE